MSRLPASLILCALLAIIGLWAAIPATAPTMAHEPVSAHGLPVSAYGALTAHATRQDSCETWARSIVPVLGVEDTAYTLHSMGCHAPYGLWVRDRGDSCMRYAYHVARIGMARDSQYWDHIPYETIGTHGHGCVIFEDGSWAVE